MASSSQTFTEPIGSGRTQILADNIHLGARDPVHGGFVMLGKTFKGMTDEMLRWQTDRLLSLAVDRGDWVVTVRPELVVEVAYDHMQGARFRHTAQFRRWRTDKKIADCTYAQLEVVAPHELADIFASGR